MRHFLRVGGVVVELTEDMVAAGLAHAQREWGWTDLTDEDIRKLIEAALTVQPKVLGEEDGA